jgi:hypothetical protein
MPSKHLFLCLIPSLCFANISAEAECGVSVLDAQYSQAKAKVDICKQSEAKAQFTQAGSTQHRYIPTTF